MLPIVIVMYIYMRWTDDKITISYSLVRMFLQLILIGYILTYIFDTKLPYLVILILSIMLIVSSIIALRPIARKNRLLYLYAFISIILGGAFTLFLVVVGVLDLSTWYEPKILIPISGMIFANSMNTVSIVAERFESETDKEYKQARAIAYKAALIPIINSFFAVGLVSLPGMMTGQILSGIDPLVAVRYQILVMLMILGSAGISAAVYLLLLRE